MERAPDITLNGIVGAEKEEFKRNTDETNLGLDCKTLQGITMNCEGSLLSPIQLFVILKIIRLNKT